MNKFSQEGTGFCASHGKRKKELKQLGCQTSPKQVLAGSLKSDVLLFPQYNTYEEHLKNN